MTSKGLLFLGISTIATLTAMPSAHAGTTKYSGAFCVRHSGGSAGVNEYGIYATGGGTLVVWCPLPVVHAGVQPVVTVNMYDRSNQTDVSCKVTGVNDAGDYIDYGGFGTVGASWSRYTDVPSGGLGPAASDSSLILQCSLPQPDSSFGGVSVIESYKITQ
jgi:hypothetical protein